MDLKHSDCVFIMGSNMAECHPVAFRWVVEAKTRIENPAAVIHVDPRFTRTSALATHYAPLRAGTDIVFLGALIKSVTDRLETVFEKEPDQLTPRDRFHRDYLVNYSNAAMLLSDDFKDTDTDDLAGVFSGWNAERRSYDTTKWRYDNGTSNGFVKSARARPEEKGKPFARIVQEEVPPPARTDPALRNPKCVWQVLRRHFARYTPELVEQVCGTPRETFRQVAETV